MTEKQAEKIIQLLADINDRLAKIEGNTSDGQFIESNTNAAVELLKTIEKNLR